MYFGALIGWTNNNFSRQCMADFRHRHMCAKVHTRRAGKNLKGTQIADPYDVKLPIGQFRIRRDLHSTAKEPRIRDAEIYYYQVPFMIVVELHDQSCAFVAERRLEHRNAKRNTPAEPLGRVDRKPVRR